MSNDTTVKRYQENGLDIREDQCPEGWVEFKSHTPCHSVTPWDYHAMRWSRERSRVLTAAGIENIVLHTNRTKLYPVGTGSGGAVRFGDAMLPPTHRIAIRPHQIAEAEKALADHDKAVRDWLDGDGPMPEACR